MHRQTRRDWLLVAGAGLVLAATADGCARVRGATTFAPGPWLALRDDGTVTIVVGKAELGQGVRTSLPMIVAEELDVPWPAVRVETASPSDAFEMSTSGSNSIADSWLPLRLAGATARAMLVSAAASRLGVARSTLRTADGAVIAVSGARIPYADLIADAARLPVPRNVPFKPRTEYRLLGTSVPKVDALAICEGRAQYGMDVRLPGMLYAAVSRAPHASCKRRAADEAAALRVDGVRSVVHVPTGIAVLADSTWAALRGRDALSATWDDSACAGLDSAAMWNTLTDAFTHARVTRPAAAVGTAAGLVEVAAEYRFPFNAHAAMEPLAATVWVQRGRIDVWAGTQRANDVGPDLAKRAGIPQHDVHVNVPLTGGAFGRRIARDYILEAYEIARHVDVPVKSVWSREDDLAHDMYQPASIHRLSALVDPTGFPVVWRHAAASFHLSMFGAFKAGAADLYADTPSGGFELPYAFASREARFAPVAAPVPTGAWRAVDYPSGVYAREAFLDEVAHRFRGDPLALRLRAIPSPGAVHRPSGDRPNGDRLRAVLQLAADRAGWSEPPRPIAGRRVGRGIACHSDSGTTMVATVADVSVGAHGDVRVDRVVCAVDAGQIINESGFRAQIEGGIVWALTAALHSEITFARGAAQQRNFNAYDVVRMRDCPEITVIPVRSTLRPFGLGESAVPPAIAAVANAVRAATGRTPRSLPIREAALRGTA